MEKSPHASARPQELHDAMARRLYRRAVATGQIRLMAVPGMLDEYVKMCDTVFAGLGTPLAVEQRDQLRTILQKELAAAFEASARSTIVISYDVPVGEVLNYVVRAEWTTIEAGYENWVNTRQPPLFGTEPDARVWALAGEAGDPRGCRVLDIGAGTGRNSLALARRGHPVDAVEMTPMFADNLRADAYREALEVRVIHRDVFAAGDDLRSDYQLIVLSEVTPDFRTTGQLRDMFELAARRLAPGGRLVFNVFVTRDGYLPDGAARELSQQCYNMFFTRGEISDAASGLGLQLVSDDSVYDYEKTHLPDGAWPPTGWYAEWTRGLDVFDVQPEACPIEMRWLVYRKPAATGDVTMTR
ncbi:class I SAM-dependent methyltransferase [Mycolicibacter sinensis]|uniref:Methyltransferase type 12 n=1 Tax=Mycolicibacter sinensis (strain JDM601) TaxID=875328 RepID=A0A1A2EKE9_MYCSD|nr:methyltransferase domain-containing protein [Mycolicibacter sinensis]OBF98131.1 methyltransferase type 12 [Mycolicibacter sinensis]OBG05291.1 methyltransferase type 12 [Mycolicibacter sinensis]